MNDQNTKNSETHRKITSATNAENLLKKLSDIDISVPRRTQGRTTDQTELYSVCRLLSTLSVTEHLAYPLSLIKRERPDFLLCCNEKYIGIEVTEATSQDYSAFVALAEHEGHKPLIEPGHFRYGKTSSLDQKRKLLFKDKLTAMPWAGDDAEKEWSMFIKDAVKNKSKKLDQPSFNKFEQNWLHIHDNIPKPILDEELLIPYFKTIWPTDYFTRFDLILIESSWCKIDSPFSQSQLIIISKNKTSWAPIKDVWR